jgi:WD domain, G-beta repeat
MTRRRTWGMAALAALAVSIGLPACKDKESLVVVTMTADYPDTTLASASISVGSHAVTFKLNNGIPYGGVSFGVYVPSSITGSQTINVVASPATAGDCNGLAGTGHVNIATAGDTYGPITVNLIPSTTACPTGGHNGTGGSGTGGRGTGGTGTGGSGGGITACTEYDHGDTGQCAMSACTKDYAVWGTAFSPTTPSLAVSGATDGRVKVWTVRNGMMTPEGHTLTGGSGRNIVAFSPDGTLLAVGQVGGVQLVDVTTWMPVRTLMVANTVVGLAFSPDGTQVITLDTVTDDVTSTTPSPGHLYVHSITSANALSSVAITDTYALGVSPVASGSNLPVVVTQKGGTALVYMLSALGFSSPTTLTVTADQSFAESAQFSPSGSLLAIGGDDGFLRFWASPFAGAMQGSAINISTVTSATSDLVDIAVFSPDGTELAIGAGFYGSVTTYATATRSMIGVEQDTSMVYDVMSLAYSHDGQYIIGGELECGCVFLCKH